MCIMIYWEGFNKLHRIRIHTLNFSRNSVILMEPLPSSSKLNRKRMKSQNINECEKDVEYPGKWNEMLEDIKKRIMYVYFL